MKKMKEVLKCPFCTMALLLTLEVMLLLTGVNALAAEFPQPETVDATKFTQPTPSEAVVQDAPVTPEVPVKPAPPEPPEKTLIGPDGFWNMKRGEGWETYYTEQDVLDCAWVLWYEYGACKSFTEKSKVVWTICNRVDDPRWGDNFRSVVTEPGQFSWHGEPKPEKISEEVITVARDVLERWNAEKNGMENVGRTLPKDSIGFWGDGQRNHFYAWVYPGPRNYYEFGPEEGPYDN